MGADMKTAEKKFTPVPWQINGTHKLFDEADEDSLIIRSEGMWIALVTPDANDDVRLGKEEVRANAEFICRAVNSHQAMYEALEAIYAGVSDRRRSELDTYSNPDALLIQLPVLWGAIRKVRDALKLAETTL